MIGALFPVAPQSAPPKPAQRAFSVTLQVVAVCLGTVVLLARVAHIPA